MGGGRDPPHVHKLKRGTQVKEGRSNDTDSIDVSYPRSDHLGANATQSESSVVATCEVRRSSARMTRRPQLGQGTVRP